CCRVLRRITADRSQSRTVLVILPIVTNAECREEGRRFMLGTDDRPHKLDLIGLVKGSGGTSNFGLVNPRKQVRFLARSALTQHPVLHLSLNRERLGL
ncbi:MAG: hypothetical protein WBL86_19015, partial [Pseudolabrys sp.]